MQDELQMWTAAVEQAVEQLIGKTPVALVSVRLRVRDRPAPEVQVILPRALENRREVRKILLEETAPGSSVRLTPAGKRAFAALGRLTVDELIEALQERFDAAPWPVLVSRPEDTRTRAESHLGPERFEALFGPEPVTYPEVSAAPASREELADLVRAFALPAWVAERAQWGLVFFADFSEEHEGWGPARGDDPVVRIIHVAAGAETTLAEPPDEPRGDYEVPVRLEERRVRFEPALTLPYLDDLSDAEDEAFSALMEGLGSPDHLLLGHPVFLQEEPREPGEVSQLQLNWDEDLGFMHGDGGQVTFFGAPDDLRAGRWDCLKATPDGS